MKSRPRYDPDSAYFTATFDLESCILESHQQLVRSVVEVVVEEERLHGQQLWEGRDQKGNCLKILFSLESHNFEGNCKIFSGS